MATRGRRARRRRTLEVALGATALIFVVLVVAGTVYYNLSRPAPSGKDTMCPATGPLGHVVLLVDKTDPLTFTQKQAYDVTLQELLTRKVPEGYLLSIFALDEDFKATAAPVFEACNPGSGAGKSEFDTNPKKLDEQFRERFLSPALSHAEALVGTQSAKSSPIFEMLQLVSINGFRKHDVKGERRLIVVSDMLQNTPKFNMYKGLTDYASFANTQYAQRVGLDMPNVVVQVHILMNSPALQTTRLVSFWESYFAKAGAQLVLVKPMPG